MRGERERDPILLFSENVFPHRWVKPVSNAEIPTCCRYEEWFPISPPGCNYWESELNFLPVAFPPSLQHQKIK